MPEKLSSVGVLDVIYLPFTATSQNGRPLYQRESPESVKERARARGIPLALQLASEFGETYKGSRSRVLVNREALEAMAPHWTQVLDNLSWFNHRYFGGIQPEYVSTSQANELVGIVVGLPIYGMFRGSQRYNLDLELPDIMADTGKVGHGFSVLTGHLSQKGFSRVPSSGRELFAIAEQQRLLVGGGQGCPAPERMTAAALDALLFGIGGNFETSELNEEPIDFAGLKELSALYKKGIIRSQEHADMIAIPAFRRRGNNSLQRELLSDLGMMQTKINTALGNDTSHSVSLPDSRAFARINTALS